MPNIEGINENLIVPQPVSDLVPAENIDGQVQRVEFLGPGTLRVGRTGEALNNSGTVANATTWVFTVTVTIDPPPNSIPLLLWTIFVDTDDDNTWAWPAGSNLTSANRPRINWGFDSRGTDPNTGTYLYKFAVKNESGGNQEYFGKFRVLVPLVSAGAS